jgi:hypothetical protein
MLKLCLAHPVFYPTFGGGSLRFLRYQPGLQKRDVQTRVLAGTSRAKDASHPHGELGWDRYNRPDAAGRVDRNCPVHRVRSDEASVRLPQPGPRHASDVISSSFERLECSSGSRRR